MIMFGKSELTYDNTQEGEGKIRYHFFFLFNYTFGLVPNTLNLYRHHHLLDDLTIITPFFFPLVASSCSWGEKRQHPSQAMIS